MILLTGPTGSGKTTAIYAALYHLVQRSGPTISISTVEDPVEFNLPMISQAQINPHKEFSYPVALRSLMRQDPQVIMVGEIRDPETAAIAVQAGLTGHLVISTIHSGSTAGVFARLINMEIEPFLLSSSIIGVIGLRLIRKNCTFCTQPYQPEQGLMRLLPPEAGVWAAPPSPCPSYAEAPLHGDGERGNVVVGGALGSVVPDPLTGSEGLHKSRALVNRRAHSLAKAAHVRINLPSGVRTAVDF